MHMPTGDCGTGDSNPEALPPPLPKEPLNPYATVTAFPVHPLSWSFIPFCRVPALQKSLKPPVQSSPCTRWGQREELHADFTLPWRKYLYYYSKWEEQPTPCLAKSSSHLGGAFSTLSKGWKSRSSLQYDLAFSSRPVAQVRLHPCLNGDALTHMRTHSFQKSLGTWWCCYNTGSPRTISLFSGLQHWHHGRCRHLAPAAGVLAPTLAAQRITAIG